MEVIAHMGNSKVKVELIEVESVKVDKGYSMEG